MIGIFYIRSDNYILSLVYTKVKISIILTIHEVMIMIVKPLLVLSSLRLIFILSCSLYKSTQWEKQLKHLYAFLIYLLAIQSIFERFTY